MNHKKEELIKSLSSKLEKLQIRVTEREQAANELVEQVFSVEISFKELETKFDAVKEEANEGIMPNNGWFTCRNRRKLVF